MRKKNTKVDRARSLRQTQTKSECLLWGLLRGKQLGGLKFRRQHPIGPFFADFACVSRLLAVEIDGGYHDTIGAEDLARETYLADQGWKVIRFTDKDIERDVESVAVQIAKHLNVTYTVQKRERTGSGMEHLNAPANRKVGASRTTPSVTRDRSLADVQEDPPRA